MRVQNVQFQERSRRRLCLRGERTWARPPRRLADEVTHVWRVAEERAGPTDGTAAARETSAPLRDSLVSASQTSP